MYGCELWEEGTIASHGDMEWKVMVTWNGRYGDLGNLNYRIVVMACNGRGAITKPNMS